MRANEQATLDQMLLHREFSVVAQMSGNAEIHAVLARPTGQADNGNQYWLQIKDSQARYEACIVGDWEFDSMLEELGRFRRQFDAHNNGALAPSFAAANVSEWLRPDDESVVGLMEVTLEPIAAPVAVADSTSGLEAAPAYRFALRTEAQQLLVHVTSYDELGRPVRRRFEVEPGTPPTVEAVGGASVDLSEAALTCLLDLAGQLPEFGLLRHPRRDWVIGYADLAGRPTVDEVDFVVRSIEDRLDRQSAEEAIGNGSLMVLQAVLRFRTAEQQGRIAREPLLTHVLASHLGRTIQAEVVAGNAMEFVFKDLKVMDQIDPLSDFTNALALLMIPADVLSKPKPKPKPKFDSAYAQAPDSQASNTDPDLLPTKP